MTRLFSRRSWVCGSGGDGFFCSVGVEEFELGWIDAFAAFIKEPREHEVDLFPEELVFQNDPFEVGAQPGVFGKEFLFARWRPLRET